MKAKTKKLLDTISMWLVAIGGVNWGLIGIFNYNLVGSFLSGTFERVVYSLVGISAVWLIMKSFKK